MRNIGKDEKIQFLAYYEAFGIHPGVLAIFFYLILWEIIEIMGGYFLCRSGVSNTLTFTDMSLATPSSFNAKWIDGSHNKKLNILSSHCPVKGFFLVCLLYMKKTCIFATNVFFLNQPVNCNCE